MEWKPMSEKPEKPMRVLFWYSHEDYDRGILHDYRISLGAWVGETPGESGWIEQGTGHDAFEWLKHGLVPTLWAPVGEPKQK